MISAVLTRGNYFITPHATHVDYKDNELRWGYWEESEKRSDYAGYFFLFNTTFVIARFFFPIV